LAVSISSIEAPAEISFSTCSSTKVVDNVITTKQGVWDPKSGNIVTTPKEIATAVKNQSLMRTGGGEAFYKPGDELVEIGNNQYVL
jgi:hypothetical protein